VILRAPTNRRRVAAPDRPQPRQVREPRRAEARAATA